MFRFSIRDVLWLTVVVGLAVGWWLDHRRTERIITFNVQLMRTVDALNSELRQKQDVINSYGRSRAFRTTSEPFTPVVGQQ